MTTTTKKRRRYLFATREAAEEAYNRRGQENTLLAVAVQALANNAVHWLIPIRPTGAEERYYRFGYVHRQYADALCFETFYCPKQEPHTAVYDEDRLNRERETYAYCPSNSEEGRARAAGLRSLAEAIHRTRPRD